MKRLLGSAAVVALAMVATGAQAQGMFTPTGANLTTDHDAGNPVNLGNVFTPTANGFATSLGFYTPTNLVGGGEQVGLYDASGTLLASTFVTVALNTPGQYFYSPIAPVALTAGQQYTVVTFVGQNAWGFGSVTTTGVNYLYNTYNYTNMLAFTMSTTGASGPAYLGPNLTIAAAVPEAATWAMMIVGFGAVGFALRTRKRPTVGISYA